MRHQSALCILSGTMIGEHYRILQSPATYSNIRCLTLFVRWGRAFPTGAALPGKKEIYQKRQALQHIFALQPLLRHDWPIKGEERDLKPMLRSRYQ